MPTEIRIPRARALLKNSLALHAGVASRPTFRFAQQAFRATRVVSSEIRDPTAPRPQDTATGPP